MSTSTLKVLIAEDSLVVATLLKNMLEEDENIQVVGVAKTGSKAVEMTLRLKPDIITMDIEMPELNGFEATKQIMAQCPTPIVVISGNVNNAALNTTFNALNAGALTVIEKPHDVLNAGFESQKRSLLTTIRALSEVRVIRRRRATKLTSPRNKLEQFSSKKLELLALGLSTGGPEVLYFILSQLPAAFPVPIVIVQHISKGFLPGLVKWLSHKCVLKIEIISEGNQILRPGTVYFADDDQHLIIKKGDLPIAQLEDSPAIEHFKPSVGRLFTSIASAYPASAMAGLLTGMGRDGAEGLLAMKQAGCQTFIQDEESCVVFGMPGQAKTLNAHCEELDLINIPSFLTNTFTKEK